ncbi:la-related protein 7-like [Homarus americanus]|nr:la-related protein 7-like [Homarus americanus]XP_042226545.1 la-related protein 7-like [Homarus americanus]
MEETTGECTNMEEAKSTSEKVGEEKTSPKDVRQRKKLLISKIMAQMEFYFSAPNISKDSFMKSLLESGPYINLDTFFKFNRILSLTDDMNLLKKAVKKSSILELSEDGLRVKRKFEVELKEKEMECTIYVENIPPHGDHDWVRQVFAQYGVIDYISLPHYRRSGRPKGFAFVEFKTPEMANSALEAFGTLECRIPTNIHPSQLQSIKTYEGTMDEDPLNIDVEDTPGNFSCDVKPGMIKDGDCGGSKIEIENEREGKLDDVGIEGADSTKRKLEHENSTVPEENIQSAKKQKLDVNIDKPDQVTSTEPAEGNSAIEEMPSVSNKKSKKRKRKRNKKEKEEVLESMYLRVMSKADWKWLRNQYLNTQKENMKSLKRLLLGRDNSQNVEYSDYCNPNFIRISKECKSDQKPNTKAVENLSQKSQSSKPQFIPNAIIKISFEEPPPDPKKLKDTIREGGGGGVAYVDVSATERDVFVRFLSEEAATTYKKTGCWSRMEVLSGAEEEEYWDRIITCWSQQRGRKNKQNGKSSHNYPNQVRGREKLLQKAVREAQTTKANLHIIFED